MATDFQSLNPFEILNIEPALALDHEQLRLNYLKAIRTHHPDKFMGNAELMANAEAESARIHEAYVKLSDPWQRMSVLMELNQIPGNEQLSPDFLMEMMDLNERISDSDGSDSETLMQEIGDQENEINSEFQRKAELYDQGNVEILKDLAELRGRMKYILRLKERITKFASRF